MVLVVARAAVRDREVISDDVRWSVIEVGKGSGRASSSVLLAIAEKQLQERR